MLFDAAGPNFSIQFLDLFTITFFSLYNFTPPGMPTSLDPLFKPRNIAVIGASERLGSKGQALFKNLSASDFKGIIYPINLRHRVVYNQKAYAYISDLPEEVDLAIIATPPATIAGLVEECGQSNVKGVLILSNGSNQGEAGPDPGPESLLEIARKYNLRLLGPDCIGYINVALGLNVSLIPQVPLSGNLAIISQSGSMLTALLDMAKIQNVGFSHVISMGPTTDIDLADLIDFLGTDMRTACILIYLDELSFARRFMSAARAFSRSKPIVVLKGGRSQEGAFASSLSSTAFGADAAYDAAFRRAGVVRVRTLAQLFNCGVALGKQPRPLQNRLAVITNSNGPAVLAVDYLIQREGRLAQFASPTLDLLKGELASSVRGANPIEFPGNASAIDFEKAIDACIKDVQVDGILVILTPQPGTPLNDIAKKLVDASRRKIKPILASWMGDTLVREAKNILEEGGVPHYRYPESAVDVFQYLYQYAKRINLLFETPPSVPDHLEPNQEEASTIIQNAITTKRHRLNEYESKALLKCYSIPVVESRIAHNPDQAAGIANEFGFPVALKILSPDLEHKSSYGGVKLNLPNEEAVRLAYQEIETNVQSQAPGNKVEGMLVDPMVKGKLELLFKATRDPILGPVIAFGKGGIAADVYQDYKVEIPPLNMALAHHLLKGTRIYPLLEGFRGLGGVDQEHIAVTLYKFAYLMMDFPEILEISINPFLAKTQGGLGVDAHVVLDTKIYGKREGDYPHLIIPPYPSQYTRKATIRNGQEIIMRPIRPEDEPLEMQMIEYLSKQTLYLRFFGQVPKISHEWLSRFTHIDYDREMAIIAELEEDGEKKMIGVVRIIQDPFGETAEYAILVADPWQGQGLGGLLTDFILEIARDKGLQRIYATLLASNDRMLNLFKRRGFRVKREDFETYSVELDL